jgi:hypothetical protein
MVVNNGRRRAADVVMNSEKRSDGNMKSKEAE